MLTDKQIEMFRHSELEELKREERQRAEQNDDTPDRGETVDSTAQAYDREVSPKSDASSIEGDLLGLGQPGQPLQKESTPTREPSNNSRSQRSNSTDPRRRPRKDEVPYDQRHKRKWEEYIEEQDALEGSLTHRRIVRELDEQRQDQVDLDY